jgi:hypothetical protein
MWASPSFRRRKASGTEILVHNVFWAKEEGGKFHTLFGRLNDNRQEVFNYFRMDISKFEKCKELLPTDSQKITVET